MKDLRDFRRGEVLPGDSGSSSCDKPAWLDMDKFKRGQEFFRDHIFSFSLSFIASVVTGLSVHNLLDPLVYTKKSDTPAKALRRYFSTFLHVARWHFQDVWDFPDGPGCQSVMAVRKMHSAVAHAMNNDENVPKAPLVNHEVSEDGNELLSQSKAKAKNNLKKVIVSQYDMSLVQVGFFGPMVLYPENFGVRCSQQDLEDYIHFWAGIGYLLGIQDSNNVCLNGLQEACSVTKEVEQTVLIPAMNNPPPHFNHMAEALVAGLNLPNRIFHLLSVDAVLAWARWAFGMSVPKLGWMDWMRLWTLRMICLLIYWLPGFEKLMNRSSSIVILKLISGNTRPVYKENVAL